MLLTTTSSAADAMLLAGPVVVRISFADEVLGMAGLRFVDLSVVWLKSILDSKVGSNDLLQWIA